MPDHWSPDWHPGGGGWGGPREEGGGGGGGGGGGSDPGSIVGVGIGVGIVVGIGALVDWLGGGAIAPAGPRWRWPWSTPTSTPKTPNPFPPDDGTNPYRDQIPNMDNETICKLMKLEYEKYCDTTYSWWIEPVQWQRCVDDAEVRYQACLVNGPGK